MLKTKSPTKAEALAAKLRPLLAAVDYTASEAIDGMNPSIAEFVLISPVSAAYKAAGKDWKERKAGFLGRAYIAALLLHGAKLNYTRDGLSFYVRT